MAKRTVQKVIPFGGVFHVTGEHDTGKTTLALQAGKPEETCFLDDDVKGKSLVNDALDSGIQFAAYHDLTEIGRGKNEYDFHKAVMDIIRGIKKNQYKVIVFDTWTRFAATCHSYVMRHKQEFRANWSPMGKIKGAQEWKEARRLEEEILNHLGSLAEIVVVTTHLKVPYIGGAPVPGKSISDSSNVLETVPRFRLWLRHNEDGRPVPTGLVLKRVSKISIVDGVLQPINVMPRKLVPNEDEPSLWHTVRRYWDNPIGDREPTKEELPSAFELSILDNTLTEDQQRTFEKLLGYQSKDEEPEEIDDETRQRILENKGKAPPIIAKAVGVDVATVMLVLKEDANE